MKYFSSLLRNSMWLFVSRIGAHAAMVIVTFVLARRLGNIGFGEYAFIAAAVMIGNTLTTFGTDIFLIREIAARTGRGAVPVALIIQLILSGMVIGMVWLGASYLPNQTAQSIAALKIYSLALIPLSFFTIFTSVLRGMQRMDIYTWMNLAISLMHALVIWFFVPSGQNVATLAYVLLLIQVVSAAIGGILCYIHAPEYFGSWKVSGNALLHLITASAPILGIALLRVLNQRLSLIILALLGGAAFAGWFSAAARIIEAARIGHHAVLSALFPMMAQVSGEGEADVSGRFRIYLLVLVVLAGAGTMLINVFASPLVNLLYGDQFQPALTSLKIMSFVFIPYTINDFFSISFIAGKKEATIIRIMIVYVLTLVVISFVLVPTSGHVGASWALLIAEILQSCLLFFAWKFGPKTAIKHVSELMEPLP